MLTTLGDGLSLHPSSPDQPTVSGLQHEPPGRQKNAIIAPCPFCRPQLSSLSAATHDAV